MIRLPAFAAADLSARLAARVGFATDTSGYRGFYQLFPAVFSMAFGATGLMFLARAMARGSGAGHALTATVIVWLASPVVYYLTIEPLMGHSLSLGLACGLVAIALRLPPARAVPQFALLGFTCGLLTVTRYQDAAYFLLPATLVWRYGIREGIATVVGAVPVIAIQLVANVVWYGSPWTTGYTAVVVPDWLAGDVWRHLFNPIQGIFTTHPIQLLGLVGLAWMSPIQKRLVVVLLVVFLAQLYAVAALVPAAPGMSFGNRTLTSLTRRSCSVGTGSPRVSRDCPLSVSPWRARI